MKEMKKDWELSGMEEVTSKEDEYEKAIENFYITEALLFNQLVHLEKKEAKTTLRHLVEITASYEDTNRLKNSLSYLATVSSLLARYLDGKMLTSRKAVAFNLACFKLINSRIETMNISEVADELIEFFIFALEEKKHPTLAHDTVNKIILYVDDEVEAPLTVQSLASLFDVSTSHLSRIFKMNTGITLVEYINIRKVEESQYHLRYSDKKISDISNQFNFCNQSYFTRIFKKYTNETPRSFRHSLTSGYFRFEFPGLIKSSQEECTS